MSDWADEMAVHVGRKITDSSDSSDWPASLAVIATALRQAAARGREEAAQYLEASAQSWWAEADKHRNDVDTEVLFKRLGNILNNSATSIRALPTDEAAGS